MDQKFVEKVHVRPVMSATANVVLDHLRRMVHLARSNDRQVPHVALEFCGAISVLWAMMQYHNSPLQTVAPSLRDMVFFLHLTSAQVVGATAAHDLSYLASTPETPERSEAAQQERAWIRHEMQQIPTHLLKWLSQQNYVVVAEMERLLQATIYSSGTLHGIIGGTGDLIFEELQECFAEVPVKMAVNRIRNTCAQTPVTGASVSASMHGSGASTPSSSYSSARFGHPGSAGGHGGGPAE